MSGVRNLLLRALPLAVLWVGFWLCLHNAWVPFGERFNVTLSDDAYYVFSVARHLAHGYPPSIDGVHATNGFHPLWTALLVPVYALFRDSSDFETPISIAMTLGAVFHLLGGALLWRILRRLGIAYGASLVSLAYFCGNAYQVANAIGGLESALATAALLWAFLEYLRARDPIRGQGLPWRFGLACGAAILGRTDQALVVAVLFAAMLPSARALPMRAAARRIAIGGAVCAAVLVPWLAFSWITCGTVVQSSGLALSLIHRRMPEVWGGADTWALRFEQIAACIAESYWLLQRALILGPYGLPVLLAATGLGAVLSEERPRTACALAGQLARLSPLLVAMLLLFAVHTCVRLSFREWYTSPFIPAVALLIGVNVDWIGRRFGRAFGDELAAVAAMLALACPLSMGYSEWRTQGLWGAPSDQPSPRAPSPQDRMAYTDCGLGSYYATTGVANLDGLTNQGAYEALRAGDLLSYIRRERFRAFGITASMQSAVFLGRRYRESLVTVNPYTQSAVEDPREKDGRIRPRRKPCNLASYDGREFLGDGWIWPQGNAGTVRSIGPYSELIFHLPSEPSELPIVIRWRAVTFGPHGTQPTTVLLNDRWVADAALGSEWSLVAIPLENAHRGRNRLRIEYGAPRAVREESRGWYRSLTGNPALAIEVSTLALPAAAPR
jgi:hypothetical protein